MALQLVLLGATGFTGSAVLRAALTRGAAVHALLRRPQVRLPASVRAIPGALPRVPAGLFPAGPCVVVHLAAQQFDPAGHGYWTPNVGGAEALMAALPPQVRGVIYGSSLSVYGQGPQRGISEQAPLRPATALARARAGAEAAIRAGARSRGIGGWLLRPRFVVGRGDRYTTPALLQLARRRLCPGGGSQRLALVDVDAYAELILHLAAELQCERGPAQVMPLNVGYRQAPTLAELLEQGQHALGMRAGWRGLPLWAPALAGLRRLPPARALATRLELVGLDHYGATDRLSHLAPPGWLCQDPLAAFRCSVDEYLKQGVAA